MIVHVNGEDARAQDEGELERLLSRYDQEDDLEIWVSFAEGASLCCLVNARAGMLMFLRFPEDTGFSSRSTDEVSDGQETFVLGNGQADDYPRAWTLRRDKAFAAILEFGRTGERPKRVTWNEDSQP